MSITSNDIKLYMVFDMLEDIVRTGPQLWKIDRKRLEDVKDHTLDLLLIYRIIRKYLPRGLNFDKVFDYAICHDLPEAITGDITRFQGVSEEDKKTVTKEAIDYLAERFSDVMDLKIILNNYEARVDIEAKIVHMIDKFHSAKAFIKYQSEQDINPDAPGIVPTLRNHPFVVQKIREGKDIADTFYEFHMKAINISDEECEKYNISREDADTIVNAIRGFAEEMYNQKLAGTLLDVREDFPREAMRFNENN